ncbi:MAG: HAMP domain-containing histidine kinase [Coriobacteriales bacterium]|nr:HAMP domain-containing histidine kinase [Coriobacteriales bacterium]
MPTYDNSASVDEVRRSRAPWTTYSARLALTFAAVAAVTVIISLLLFAIVWEQRFHNYSEEQLQSFANITAETLSQRYELTGGWSEMTTRALPDISALSNGATIMVVDSAGLVRYDDYLELTGQPRDPVSSVSKAKSAAVVVGNQQVATVYVESLQEEYLSPSDINLRADSYRVLLATGVIAIMLAIVTGIVFARTLVNPFRHISSVADLVRRGNLTARTGMVGNDELSHLGQSVDEMIASIEQNAVYERQLTSDLAHELRTPLMAMQATIEAMIDGVLPADQTRLDTLNSEVIRLGRLVEAQLHLARLEQGKAVMHLENLDLSQLIQGLVESHEMLAEETKLKLVFSGDPAALVYGDADLLRQATNNLISNAERYTPPGGTIQVSVRRETRVARIVVADTGIGISEDDLSRVFLRFFRADEGRDRESGGLGVGLAVVKEIAEQHHGWVGVESELGKGSTFTIYIPLLSARKSKQKRRSKN